MGRKAHPYTPNENPKKLSMATGSLANRPYAVNPFRSGSPTVENLPSPEVILTANTKNTEDEKELDTEC